MSNEANNSLNVVRRKIDDETNKAFIDDCRRARAEPTDLSYIKKDKV